MKRLLIIILSSIIGALAHDPNLIPSIDGKSEYLMFTGHYATSHELAVKTCVQYGGNLANIPDINTITYLGNNIYEPLYIRSWGGNTYEGTCIALYPGSPITSKKNFINI